MSATEPTTIDEKKAEDSDSTTDKADWKGFSKNFSNGLITGIFFGVVVIGSMGLFLAKVANANILPTKCDIEPYPSSKPLEKMIQIRDVPIDIIYMNPVKILGLFGLKFWEEPTPDTYFIQEANFVNGPAELNFMNDFKNSWLCTLKNKAYPPEDPKAKEKPPVDSNNFIKPKDKPKNSPFWAYEFETMKSMTCTSFSIINKVFFYMNYLPEWATMILFALFFSVIITVIFIANMLYGIWDHISNFGELVKNLYNFEDFNGEQEDPREAALPFYKKWSTITNVLYLITYFIGAMYSAIIISPVVVTCYTFFKALGANYVVRDKNFDINSSKQEDAPKQNVFSFIKSALYYKKTFIIILVMLNLMGATNEYLGTSYLPGVIIALLILIFGLKILNIDKPENLYSVVNSNFPPLSQPQVNLENTEEVEICKEEKIFTKTIREKLKTITGFFGPNIFKRDTTKPPNLAGGGRVIKPLVTTNVPKSKTKMYNLKLV
jgi:hypothetical protein